MKKETKNKNTDPSITPEKRKIWDEFFKIAFSFLKMEPWKVHGIAEHPFAYGDPGTSNVAFLSVMGQLGQLFGLAVYPGEESWQYGTPNEDVPPKTETLVKIDSIILDFIQPIELGPKERDFYAAMGLPLKQLTLIPSIRSYKPGFYPWSPDDTEVQFMNYCISLVCQMTGAIQNFSFNPSQMGQSTLVVQPKEKPEADFMLNFIHTRREARSKALGVGSLGKIALPDSYPEICPTMTWEVGTTLLETAVKDSNNERAFFPRQVMLVDHESTFILGTNAIGPDKSLTQVAAQLIIEAGLQHERLPSVIQVNRKDLADALDSFVTGLGSKIEYVKTLTAFNQAMRAVNKMIKGDSKDSSFMH